MDPKISMMLGTIVQELSLAVYSAETSNLQEWCCSTPRTRGSASSCTRTN